MIHMKYGTLDSELQNYAVQVMEILQGNGSPDPHALVASFVNFGLKFELVYPYFFSTMNYYVLKWLYCQQIFPSQERLPFPHAVYQFIRIYFEDGLMQLHELPRNMKCPHGISSPIDDRNVTQEVEHELCKSPAV